MKFITFISAFMLCIVAMGQNVKIVDQTDMSPLGGAAVSSVMSKLIFIADEKGNIDLTSLPNNDTIVVTHMSYQSVRIAVSTAKKEKNIFLTRKLIMMSEMIISANKFEEKREDLPQLVEFVPKSEIQFSNPMSAGDMLENSGRVFVQQSQFGGSSPVLRGFEANRVLLVVDGIRMNNAVYRSGHLQNVITIDPEMLDRTEIIFGPGSVIYGSDALGGVMAFFTESPRFSSNNKLVVSGKALTRYSTASNEEFGSVSLNIGKKKWASYTNFTYKNLGDLRTGNIRNPFYGDWGKCLYYAERVDGKDSMMTNDNPNIQKNSGYSQYDLLQKFSFKLSEKSLIKVNFQYSNSSDVPRYDRLTEMSSGKLKYAEWYYGPQTRLMGTLSFETRDLSFADNARFSLNYQNISEDRVSRKFNKDSRRHQEETIDVMGFYADLMKKIEKHELRYGAEFRADKVQSVAYAESASTGLITYNEITRYPDDDNQMMSAAAYLSHAWELSNKLIATQGLRFTFVSLESAWTDTMMTLTGFPFNKKVEQSNSALSGNLGFVYNPNKKWRFALNGATGFRSPNVDDVGKVNDSNSGSLLLVVPNPELKPEYSYTGEISIGRLFSDKVWFENTFFYTYLDNAIVMAPTTLNGSDSVMFDGTMCKATSAQNVGSAFIYGVQSSLTAEVSKHFSIRSYVNYTYGKLTEEETPLDHIPPTFGQTSFRLTYNKFMGEFYVRYSSWKRLKNYSPSGEDNIAYATAYGMPSWTTLNVKASYQINPHLQFQAGVENIMDVHYRKFASGISSPGRNLILALRAKF